MHTCVHVLQPRGVCMSCVCRFSWDMHSWTCEWVCVHVYSCWYLQISTINERFCSTCVSFMSLHTHSEVCEQVSVFAVCVHTGRCVTHLSLLVWPCVPVSRSVCPHRSLPIGMHMFSCVSILPYAHIWFCWYAFGHRRMLFCNLSMPLRYGQRH